MTAHTLWFPLAAINPEITEWLDGTTHLELFVEELPDRSTNLTYQHHPYRKTPTRDFCVCVHANGRITGQGSRKHRDLIKTAMTYMRSHDG